MRDIPGGDVRPIEAERFGQPHDTLGADLLEAWGLPQSIADAARHHHAAPPLTQLTLVQQAVWVANLLAGTPEEAAQAAKVSPDGLAPVKQAVAEASQRSKPLPAS